MVDRARRIIFDLLSLGVEGVIDGILCILLEIPFYITIVTLTFLALYKSGRETGDSPS